MKINNIDEFNKIAENFVGSRFYRTKEEFNDPNKIIGYSWIIRDPETMKDPRVRKIFGANTCICDDLIKYKEKVCVYSDVTLGILIGVEITEEDFYYILKVGDKELYYSCVGNLELA